jgi:hypothetical protein
MAIKNYLQINSLKKLSSVMGVGVLDDKNGCAEYITNFNPYC